MIKKLSIAFGLAIGIGTLQAQQQDTVIIKLGHSSQVIFTINDRSDLETLKHYNFQALFEDIIEKIESKTLIEKGTVAKRAVEIEVEEEITETEDEELEITEEIEFEEDEEEIIVDLEEEMEREFEDEKWSLAPYKKENNENDCHEHHDKINKGGTWHTVNIDLGMNNFIKPDGSFPDADNALYAVRPWGSWYTGFNSVNRSRLAQKLFLEWGAGISWYNFKFQRDNVILSKDDDGIVFAESTQTASFEKSKLTVSYINFFLIPVIDFNGKSFRPRMWDDDGDGFRFGLGPYAGYRIGSHSKSVFDDGNGKEKDKNRDNFYLENFRYGLRFQMGFRSTDIFINYDMNDLFSPQRGPELSAFSFGIIL